MSIAKSTIGLETEMYLINEKGHMVNNCDNILKRVEQKSPHAQVIPEVAENMIEFGSTPSVKVSESASSLIENMSLAIKAASKEKTLMLPLATYPGKFKPLMRDKGLYKIKKKLFGERFPLAGKCIGFHLHHALPEGSFDATSKNLKAALSTKTSNTLLSVYNFSVAIDPVLTTFMQSSPFYEGEQMAKDCRMVLYRGGDVLNYPDRLYVGDLEKFGELPKYKLENSEFLDMIIEYYSNWKNAIRLVASEELDSANYGSILHTNWSPVKINPHGTLEIRGMDMNFPSLIFSLAVAVKYLFKRIYENSLKIVPSVEGINEYFKEEKGQILVSTDTYVHDKLQFFSAYFGMDNDSLNEYCKRFLKLAKKVIPSSTRKVLTPFEEMVEEKKTVSDQVIKKAEELGYSNEERLPDEISSELSLYYAGKFIEDLKKSYKLIEKYENA